MRYLIIVLSLFLITCGGGSTGPEESKLPIVQNINLDVIEDIPKTFVFVGTDPLSQALSYSVSTQPQHGTISISGGAGTYTPTANYNGEDLFLYIASSVNGNSNIGTVAVTIFPEDDDPNSKNMQVSTDEDTTIDITLDIEEYDGDNISVSIKNNPQNGSVSLAGSIATYIPNENYFGSDSFTYEAIDQTEKKVLNVALVSLTINPINDPPSSKTMNTYAFLTLEKYIQPALRDPENDNITLSVSSQPSHGSVEIVADGGAEALIYTANQSASNDQFTFEASDGTDTSESTVNIEIFKEGINGPIAFNPSMDSRPTIDGYLQVISYVSSGVREINLLSTDLESIHSTSNTLDTGLANFRFAVHDFSMTPNGNGYYIVGEIWSSLNDGNENRSDGYIAYFNSSGDKVWEKIINGDGIFDGISQYDATDNRSDSTYQLIVDDDNTAIISGSREGGSGGSYVMKINPNGEKVWELSHISVPDAAIKYIDGNFLFIGSTRILRVDSNGNILALTNYDIGNSFDFTILSNGDIAVVSKKSMNSSDPTGYGYSNPKIVIFDGDLNHKNTIVLDSIHSDLYGGGIHFEQQSAGITETADGGLIVVGTYSKISNHTLRMFALKLSSDDSIEWEKTFGGDPNERDPYHFDDLFSYYVTELPNQNLRIACDIQKEYGYQKSFYFDLDSQGNRIF